MTGNRPQSGGQEHHQKTQDPPNALTFDVEEYFHVEVFKPRIRPSDWNSLPARVERNVYRILELLSDAGVKATFFVLGWIAQRHPRLVREIADCEHEIGSHGTAHTPLWDLTPESFSRDLAQARDAIGSACGVGPTCYRAPSFSIVPRTTWALEILYANGYRSDSSIFPVRHPSYGLPAATPDLHRIRFPDGGSILEFPLSTIRFLGMNWGICGGAYFRFVPFNLTHRALAQIRAKGRPFVFYLHPWEIDPTQPDLREMTSRTGRLRHYFNLERTESRLIRLLEQFSFSTIGDVHQWVTGNDIRLSTVEYSPGDGPQY